jgi:hypothetical protein
MATFFAVPATTRLEMFTKRPLPWTKALDMPQPLSMPG